MSPQFPSIFERAMRIIEDPQVPADNAAVITRKMKVISALYSIKGESEFFHGATENGIDSLHGPSFPDEDNLDADCQVLARTCLNLSRQLRKDYAAYEQL